MSFALDEVLIRMGATAFVVMAVAWAVGVFGPRIGGAIAGLPIVLGPGFYFLCAHAPAPFVAEAAAYALYSLCATQCFLLAYLLAADRASPLVCLLVAVGVWALMALMLRPLPAIPSLGLLLFMVATAIGVVVGARHVRPVSRSGPRPGFALLLLRGALAGALVAGVTAAAGWLGPAGAGLLMAFPVGYTVVALTLHQTMGADQVRATLHAALLGTSSLAAFCASLALTMTEGHQHESLLGALAISILLIVGLVLGRHHLGR